MAAGNEAGGHAPSAVRDECEPPPPFFHPVCSEPPAHGKALPHLQWGFPPQSVISGNSVVDTPWVYFHSDAKSSLIDNQDSTSA